jgi:hypothetical protein
MNCTDVKAQLPFLSPQDREQIEDPEIRAHLASCPSCLQEWQELEQLGTLLSANPEPRVVVDLASLYRRAAMQEARTSRRWRWLGIAASLLLLLGGAGALLGRLEIRITGHELALRWVAPPFAKFSSSNPTAVEPAPNASSDKRGEQIELLNAMVSAMLQELQTVEMRQRRDRADMDVIVSGLQEQTLSRWLAIKKDMEALYFLAQKGE